MQVHIITDSTSDIPDEVLRKLPISVFPVYILMNGKSYLDNIDLSREEFYERLPDADPHPQTAAPSPGQFRRVFDEAADQGAEALFSIHITNTFSAIIQSAKSAADNYSRIPVHVIDSGNLSLAEGLIVIQAARAAKEGKSESEISAIIEDTIIRTFAYAKLDTIDYLLRGGRMTSIQYSVVSLLGILPILKMNNHVSRMEITRTKNKAFQRVLNSAIEHIPYAEAFGITHAGVPDQVDELIRQMKMIIPGLPDPLVSEATPALGAHVGPGALCVNWIESSAHIAAEKKGLRKWLS